MWEEFFGYDAGAVPSYYGTPKDFGVDYISDFQAQSYAYFDLAPAVPANSIGAMPPATFAPGVLEAAFPAPASPVSAFTPASSDIRRPWPGLELWPAATLPETIVTARRNPAPAAFFGAPMYDDALLRIVNGQDGTWTPEGVRTIGPDTPYYGGLAADYAVYDIGWGRETWRGALPASIPASPLSPWATSPRIGLPAVKASSSWASMLPLLALGAAALFLIAKK